MAKRQEFSIFLTVLALCVRITLIQQITYVSYTFIFWIRNWPGALPPEGITVVRQFFQANSNCVDVDAQQYRGQF